MPTPKREKRRVKKVKGWAVLVFGDMISHFHNKEGIDGRAIFFDYSEAKKELKTFDTKDGKMQNAKIIPVTITYVITAKKKGG